MKGNTLRAAVAAAALFSGASPAAARHEIGAIGPSGDRQTTVTCPPGEELRGFRGRSGVWIDQIQILCAGRNPDGSYRDAHAWGAALGGTGGAEQSDDCGSRQTLGNLSALRTNDLRRIAKINFGCRSGSAMSGHEFGNGGYGRTEFGTATVINGDCDRFGEVLVGIAVNYGKDVNGLGYVCDQRR